MELNILRVSLVPINDGLFVEIGIERDITMFELALDRAKERKDEYSIKVRIYDHENGYMAGIISKKSNVKFHDRNFALHTEDDFPPVLWFWDRAEQVILIEKKTNVFSSASVAAKTFSKISNNLVLIENGFRAHINPVLVESAFLETFNSFDYVSEVGFELTAPNLFGNTKKDIGDFLHEVVNETNASEFKPVFKNQDGNLNLKQSNWLNAMIDWVKDGAGSWYMWGKYNLKGKSKRITSEQRAKLLVVDGNITEIELNGYTPEDVAGIVGVFREQYTYKK